MSAAAIRSGKAVFCEKPLTHNVQETHTLQQWGEFVLLGNVAIMAEGPIATFFITVT
ncbi:MAG: hypothetical protein JW828_14720 [Sedimentisphaerales bacterium]|nr:hypothetical protein [Sedimentisphaerales bacterium]